MCILKKKLRKPICDIVFRIRYFELCVYDFCVLTFEQKLHMGRMSYNCIKYNIIRIPVFFLSLCTRFFSFLESANLLYIFFSSLLKGKTLSQKHITQKSKGKTHNIKLKSKNTEVTSYEHRIQNICTRNTMSYLGFRYTYCVLCADVLNSVFITSDFCILTFEFHVLSFPFCALCYMFWGL